MTNVYHRKGTIEITYSNGIKQRFQLNGGKDSLIVHHKHTYKYIGLMVNKLDEFFWKFTIYVLLPLTIIAYFVGLSIGFS